MKIYGIDCYKNDYLKKVLSLSLGLCAGSMYSHKLYILGFGMLFKALIIYIFK